MPVSSGYIGLNCYLLLTYNIKFHFGLANQYIS